MAEGPSSGDAAFLVLAARNSLLRLRIQAPAFTTGQILKVIDIVTEHLSVLHVDLNVVRQYCGRHGKTPQHLFENSPRSRADLSTT